jgi:hypothetical protein
MDASELRFRLKAIRHLRMDNARYTGLLLEAGVAPEQHRLRNRLR